jgi:hypothetical protein
MANIRENDFKNKVALALRLRGEEDSSLVELIIELAVKDIFRELGSDIGTRTVYDLSITNEDNSGYTFSRIYLPEDALFLRSLFINDEELICIDQREGLKQKLNITSTAGKFVGTIHTSETGRLYVELTTTYTVDTVAPPVISCIYRVNYKDITYIPEAYFDNLLYACVYHYRCLYEYSDLDSFKISKANYDKRLNDLRSLINNATGADKNKFPYEVLWQQNTEWLYAGNRGEHC